MFLHRKPRLNFVCHLALFSFLSGYDPISTLEMLSALFFSLSPYTPLLVVVPFVSHILFFRSSSHTSLVRLRYAFIFPSISLSLGTPTGSFMMCRSRPYVSVWNRKVKQYSHSLSNLDDFICHVFLLRLPIFGFLSNTIFLSSQGSRSTSVSG